MGEEKKGAGCATDQCYSNRREHWEKKPVEDEIGFAVRPEISTGGGED